MSRADRLLIAVLALVALAAWPLAALAIDGSGEQVVVTGPQGSSSFPLSGDLEIAVVGSRGPVSVEVSEGRVRVVESDCPNHACVETGSISAAGSVVACVPNRVVVRIAGGDDDGLDARIR